jgi:sRNA-binding carbon storage regulator CsrA
MLVLTRKAHEGITLKTSDGEIYIGFSTGNPNIPIKVAIEAPQAVTVLRDELVIKRKNSVGHVPNMEN